MKMTQKYITIVLSLKKFYCIVYIKIQIAYNTAICIYVCFQKSIYYIKPGNLKVKE